MQIRFVKGVVFRKSYRSALIYDVIYVFLLEGFTYEIEISGLNYSSYFVQFVAIIFKFSGFFGGSQKEIMFI